jgi:hypothetical protein
MTRRRCIAYGVAAVIATAIPVVACREQTAVSLPPPPSGLVPPPGLSLSLASPNTNDGAVFFELHGPAIKSAVVGNEGSRLFTELVSDTLMRAVVIGSFAGSSPLMAVTIGNGHSPGDYRANVIEVADQAGVLRSSVGTYSVTIVSR